MLLFVYHSDGQADIVITSSVAAVAPFPFERLSFFYSLYLSTHCAINERKRKEKIIFFRLPMNKCTKKEIYNKTRANVQEISLFLFFYTCI